MIYKHRTYINFLEKKTENLGDLGLGSDLLDLTSKNMIHDKKKKRISYTSLKFTEIGTFAL